MQSRMTNPAFAVPDAMPALQAISRAAMANDGVSHLIHALVHLRASQINGCSVCVDMHAKDLRKAGESDERLFAVAAWREAPYFTEAELAALIMTISTVNLWNRLNASTRQIAGAAW